MNAFGPWKYGVLLCGVMGCTSLSHPFFTFQPTAGQYFPPFIVEQFPEAARFNAQYRQWDEAQHGMKVIAIRRLSTDNLPQNEANLSWSADGSALGFEIDTGLQKKILVRSLAKTWERELVVLPQTQDNFLSGLVNKNVESYNAGLSWSKDGKRFAFMSNGGQGEYNIYVGALGEKEQPVAPSQSKDGYAVWSPKQDEIVFVSGRTGQGDLYTYDVNAEHVQQLTNQPQADIFPEWHPSGDALVYASGDAATHQIMTIERLKGQWQSPRPLTDAQADLLRPIYSPDGRWLAFYMNRRDHHDTQFDLVVIPAQPTALLRDEDLAMHVVARQVAVDLNTGPAWSPDSRKLFFVVNNAEQFNPIAYYDLFSGDFETLKTQTMMNRDIIMSRLGVLSFRAQVGSWERVFIALTNQSRQLQKTPETLATIRYLPAKG